MKFISNKSHSHHTKHQYTSKLAIPAPQNPIIPQTNFIEKIMWLIKCVQFGGFEVREVGRSEVVGDLEQHLCQFGAASVAFAGTPISALPTLIKIFINFPSPRTSTSTSRTCWQAITSVIINKADLQGYSTAFNYQQTTIIIDFRSQTSFISRTFNDNNAWKYSGRRGTHAKQI